MNPPFSVFWNSERKSPKKGLGWSIKQWRNQCNFPVPSWAPTWCNVLCCSESDWCKLSDLHPIFWSLLSTLLHPVLASSFPLWQDFSKRASFPVACVDWFHKKAASGVVNCWEFEGILRRSKILRIRRKNPRPCRPTLELVERFSWTDTLSLFHLFHDDLKTPFSLFHLFHVDLKTSFSFYHLFRVLQLVPTCAIWLYHLFFDNPLFSDFCWVSQCQSIFRKTLLTENFHQITIMLERANKKKIYVGESKQQENQTCPIGRGQKRPLLVPWHKAYTHDRGLSLYHDTSTIPRWILFLFHLCQLVPLSGSTRPWKFSLIFRSSHSDF